MPSILSDRTRLIIFISGGLLVFIAWILPLPPPTILDDKTMALTGSGKICMGIMAMVILFWMTEIMPFPIAGFLAIVLLHLFGVQPFPEILADGFGHPITCFIIGILLFSLAVSKSGLANRITQIILNNVGNNPRKIIVAFLFTGAILSMWMSDTAVAAILMPMAVSILKAEGLEPLQSDFGRALLIACVWGPSVGGLATPAGASPNPIALSFLRDMAGVEKSFLDWMILGVPVMLLLLPVSCFILLRIFPPEISKLAKYKPSDASHSLPLSRKEWAVILVFVLTVSLWVFGPSIGGAIGVALSMEYVIFSTTILLFIPSIDVLKWPEVQRELPWSALLLVMIGVALGNVVGNTGVAEWFSFILLNRIDGLPLFVIVVLIALTVTILHNFFSSNTVTAVVMIPIVIYTALLLGIPVWLAMAPAAFCATMGLILVTSTPTNLIPYSAGYFSMRDFAKVGVPFSLLGSVVVGVVIFVMHSLFGIE